MKHLLAAFLFVSVFATQSARTTITFDPDREAIERMLAPLPLPDPRGSKIARIADTLALAEMEISEPLWNEVRQIPARTALSAPRDVAFDAEGNLTPR